MFANEDGDEGSDDDGNGKGQKNNKKKSGKMKR
jgi:hypothetical protein